MLTVPPAQSADIVGDRAVLDFVQDGLLRSIAAMEQSPAAKRCCSWLMSALTWRKRLETRRIRSLYPAKRAQAERRRSRCLSQSVHLDQIVGKRAPPALAPTSGPPACVRQQQRGGWQEIADRALCDGRKIKLRSGRPPRRTATGTVHVRPAVTSMQRSPPSASAKAGAWRRRQGPARICVRQCPSASSCRRCTKR